MVRRGGLWVWGVVVAAGGCGAEAPRPSAPAVAAPAPDEPDSPIGPPTVETHPPAPTDAGSGEPLPPGARCRIGTARFRHSGVSRGVALAFPADTTVRALDGGRLRAWDVETGAERPQTTVGAKGALRSLSPRGRCAYGLEPEGDRVSLFLTDVERGVEVVRRSLQERDVGVGQDALRKMVLVPSDDCSVSMWTAETYACFRRFDGKLVPDLADCSAQSLFGVGLSGRGDRIAVGVTGPSGAQVRIHDGKMTPVATVDDGGRFALSDDGRLLAVASKTGGRIVDIDRNAETAPMCPAEGGAAPQPIAFSPFRKRLAVAYPKGGVGVCDTASGRLLWRHAWVGPARMQFSPTGKLLAYDTGVGIRVVDALTGKDVGPPPGLIGVTQAVLTPDGARAVIESAGYFSVWSADSCKLERTFPANEDLRHMVPLPGGRFALGGDRRTLVRMDLQTGERKSVELGFFPSTIAISPDGTTAALLSDERGKPELVVVDVGPMTLRRISLASEWEQVFALVIDQGAKTAHIIGLLRADRDRSTYLALDVASGKPRHTLRLDARVDARAKLVDDGKVLRISADDDTMQLSIDLATGELIPSPDVPHTETPLRDARHTSVAGLRVLSCDAGACDISGP